MKPVNTMHPLKITSKERLVRYRLHVAFAAMSIGCSALAIACSTTNQGAGESDITAVKPRDAGVDADTPAMAAQKRLAGAWVHESGGSGEAALVLSPESGVLRVRRDIEHKKAKDIDKQEVDRSAFVASVTAVDGDSGKVEISTTFFVKNDELRQVGTYSFALKTDGAKELLTLTETERHVEKVDPANPSKKGPTVDAGAANAGGPLRPAVTFARADSWCAVPASILSANDDCKFEFDTGVFKPGAMPSMCAGTEELCMSCEAHVCKIHNISSCEHAGNKCFSSMTACEFTRAGEPAGQIATLDTDGHEIDCANSPSGRSVCCQDLTGAIRDQDE
jgi:hypothetical protein